MVFPEEGNGSRAFPADLARSLVGYFAERGVEVLSGRKVTNLLDKGRGFELEGGGGLRCAVGAVAVGVGYPT